MLGRILCFVGLHDYASFSDAFGITTICQRCGEAFRR